MGSRRASILRAVTLGVIGVATLAGCKAGAQGATATASGGSGGGASTATNTGAAGTNTATAATGFMTGSTGTGNTSCSAASQLVYTLTYNNELYSFDPPTLTFALIGTLDCPDAGGQPYSMAVDRNADAWSIFTDGQLFRIDTKTAHCTPTAYVAGQNGWTTFGMGFSSDAPGSSAETLYVSEAAYPGNGTTKGLGKIDLTTMKLTPIAMYDQLNARAELTGTGDAKLFGAFEGTPYDVAQIDKTTAKILSQAKQSSINYPPNSSNFAFAFWGGDFWLFVGPGTSTDVFHYKVSANMTTMVKSVPMEIVGAGVSTCAPVTPM